MTDRTPPVATRWQTATVVGTRQQTPTARTLVLDVPGWPGHRPGQHLDVRLTAADGYRAQRSYSIASAPERPNLELVVELLMTGEVSPWLARIAEPGDQCEVRGPIGGPFAWTVADGGPLLLVGGGSGVAPLLAMLRHRACTDPSIPARVVVSARTARDLIAADELAGYGAVVTFTRGAPPGWTGATGRVDAALLAGAAASPGAADAALLAGAAPPPAVTAPGPTRCFVCGPTGFVEHVAGLLVGLGHPAARVATERFGPTG